MKVYVRVTGSIDLIKLQLALDLLTDWASKWQLQLSVDKCFTLNLGKPKSDVASHIDSNILPVVQTSWLRGDCLQWSGSGMVLQDCLWSHCTQIRWLFWVESCYSDTRSRFQTVHKNCVHRSRAVFFSERVINVSNQIVAKAHQRANNILRCVVSRDPQSLTKAFITYVRHCLSIIVLSGRLTLSKILTV